jgi:uncharacterized protein (TIGR02646 family)
MIHVDRSKVAVPAVLTQPGGKADKERVANAALAAQQRFKDMKFTAYKDPSVMQLLGTLFNGKCAYCESRYLAQQPGDVEHFRPKAAVAVKDASGKVVTVAGYHWLAADWGNLLPSCADCNRPRKHEIKSGAGKRVMGKANWFPVDPEAHRASQPAAVPTEPRLLIDPCTEDPSQHIVFDEDGTVAALAPNFTVSPMGAATIEYCALARLELTQERHKRGKEVLYVIDNVLRAKAASDLNEAKRHAAQLSTLIDASAPYSAYASSLVVRHLGHLRAELGL